MNNPSRTPELSRTVIADKVTTSGGYEVVTAGDAECAALATRFDLISLSGLTAKLRLRRVRGDFIKVTGELEADVVQRCVVTLEPVPAHVKEEFSALYAPDHLIPKEEEDAESDHFQYLGAEEDFPEPMPGGRIDIGELVAQNLSLALDPYPRRDGVEFTPILEDVGPDTLSLTGDEPAEPPRQNPFAALSRLKKPS
ncbi:YceD family protein [Niveispirillum fermenti]|uniref:YceD family protein n=1 Tax=Niveispirillum fermenti TaxID=1233113 RepID=UPI003A8C35A4